tara:strand:- start:174 stop:605 length:432 start_codon:yes stop_codon:yes gene_type:complete
MNAENQVMEPQTSYVRSQFDILSPGAKANGWDSDEDEKSDNSSQNFEFDEEHKSPKFEFGEYPGLSKSESVMQMEGIKPSEPQGKLLIRNKEFFDNPSRKEEDDSDDDCEDRKENTPKPKKTTTFVLDRENGSTLGKFNFSNN